MNGLARSALSARSFKVTFELHCIFSSWSAHSSWTPGVQTLQLSFFSEIHKFSNFYFHLHIAPERRRLLGGRPQRFWDPHYPAYNFAKYPQHSISLSRWSVVKFLSEMPIWKPKFWDSFEGRPPSIQVCILRTFSEVEAQVLGSKISQLREESKDFWVFEKFTIL